MTVHYKMLIDGRWTDASTGESFPTVNPYNQEPWAMIPQASEMDVDEAVQAARRTYMNEWRHINGHTRTMLMTRLAELLEANASRMAMLETTDNGKVIRETENQMKFAARNYRFFGGYADKLYGETIPLDNANMFDYTVREPLGVVVLIISWNSPISILCNKLAPALAAGNTVVIKPSEHASATTLEFGKLVQEAGFPNGVVNIVTGDGEVGDWLTKHPLVSKISFTGGEHTGKLIARNASERLIPVTLELGGKSPNIIFDDADLDRATIGAIAGIFGAAGQSCIAGSRLLVQETVYREVVERLAARTQTIKLGNPLDSATEMGPAANKLQYDRILSRIELGKQEGARIVTDDAPLLGQGLERGYFIAPTIFADVDNEMTIAREEIFGPVLCVIPFRDEEHAVEIANDSRYGLASGLWTRDLSRAHRLARSLEAGTVWINTYRSSAAQAPFGGIKASGFGKERGWHAMLDYTTVKNVMIDLSDDVRDPFSIRT